MNKLQRFTTASTAAMLLAVGGLAQAQESSDPAREAARMVITACDANKDGMVSKQEFMKHMEKMFEKVDTKKAGKINDKQLQQLLSDLMKSGA